MNINSLEYYSKITVTSILNIIIFIVLLVISANIFAAETYSFGIVPQQPASKIVKVWSPVLTYLNNKTGYKLVITTAKNIPAFERQLKKGNYDIAYMNPYHYVTYHKSLGYKAFAKAKDKKIHGIVIIHRDSGYKNLSDLANNKLAFPSPLAFAASILPRGQLSKINVEFTPVYVLSHDSVYLNVANKNFIAGGGVMRTFKAVSKNVREQLRILYKTLGYTPHAFAAHPRVPENVIQDILKAMVKMENDPQGIILLKTLKLKGLESASNKSWDDVRELNINQR